MSWSAYAAGAERSALSAQDAQHADGVDLGRDQKDAPFGTPSIVVWWEKIAYSGVGVAVGRGVGVGVGVGVALSQLK